MSLFQLLLSLILCVSAAKSPALGPCETQVAVVNSQFFNTVFFFFFFPNAATTQGLWPHCMLLSTRVRSGGRPPVRYLLIPLTLLSFCPPPASRAHVVGPGCLGQRGTAALWTGFHPPHVGKPLHAGPRTAADDQPQASWQWCLL